jgi:hypothetical protein
LAQYFLLIRLSFPFLISSPRQNQHPSQRRSLQRQGPILSR